MRTSLKSTAVTHLLRSPSPYLFSLDQLLVNGVWEGPQGTELAGALGAHEDTILIHDSPPADGNQRHAMTAHVLVQVEVSSLNLGAGRDGPGGERYRCHSSVEGKMLSEKGRSSVGRDDVQREGVMFSEKG